MLKGTMKKGLLVHGFFKIGGGYMRIVVFGTGRFFANRKNELYKINDNIVAFIDNKISNCESFEGYNVFNPEECKRLKFDKVILMSLEYNEMRKQLINIGIDETKIYSWEQYKCERLRGQIHLYIENLGGSKKNVLVVSTNLNYDGGSLAALYAVRALMECNYTVWLAVPKVDERLLAEVRCMGVNIAICPGLPYISEKELHWIKKFNYVIVNVFQMIECAYKIREVIPVVWWIHEPLYDSNVYEETFKKFPKYRKKNLSKIHTVAVSEKPRENFNLYFPDMINKLMPYGIPDEYEMSNVIDSSHRDMVFCIIGSINKRKAQMIFVEAAIKIIQLGYKNVSFWLIGNYESDLYCTNIKNEIKFYDEIKLCGLMTRQDLNNVFYHIDILVCCSIEDPLPIVVTEGMMHGKVCIVSDAVGQASMINNAENGFVTKTGDVDELSRTMEWVILHRNELDDIKKKSRELYEKYFTMEKFGERLERELLEAEKLFYARKGDGK